MGRRNGALDADVSASLGDSFTMREIQLIMPLQVKV